MLLAVIGKIHHFFAGIPEAEGGLLDKGQFAYANGETEARLVLEGPADPGYLAPKAP